MIDLPLAVRRLPSESNPTPPPTDSAYRLLLFLGLLFVATVLVAGTLYLIITK